ncbi:MAG: carbohydrate binding domain-containing protein [Candidatus Omnitrophica bacterium]|nr:carbohydrate binding domain-containing protein [Candidatus Omnitrophota bacterium]
MKPLLAFGLTVLTLIGVPPAIFAEEPAQNPGKFVIADFNNLKNVNNIDESIEVWLKDDGSDATQKCEIAFVQDDALGKPDGYALAIHYDVNSPNPAYNGVRIGLNGFDATQYKTLNFYAKGDASKGFSPKLRVELIGQDKRSSPYTFDGVTEEWRKVTIPLSDFWMIGDWSQLVRFDFVFADNMNEPRSGTIYIDEVFFAE